MAQSQRTGACQQVRPSFSGSRATPSSCAEPQQTSMTRLDEVAERLVPGTMKGVALPSRTSTGAVRTAAQRWASLIAVVAASDVDVRTVKDWARLSYVSESTLRLRCAVCGTTAKTSLWLARLVRVAAVWQNQRDDIYNVLDVLDPRTMAHWMDRCGARGVQALRLGPEVFLGAQELTSSLELTTALASVLFDKPERKPA